MANNAYWANVLIGGGAGALDAIDGAALADLDMAVVITLTGIYIYSLDDDSAAAEMSPNVITPDANGGNKRWILTNVVNQQQNNLIKNGDFGRWEDGAAAAPDGWTFAGAGGSIAREATTIRLGEYSAKLTRGGANVDLYTDAVTSIDADTNTYWRGRTVAAGCWVWASVADRAILRIDDNIGGTNSSYHTGGSGWEWLTVTRTLNAAATNIRLYCRILTGDTDAYFDGAILVEGSIAPTYTPKFLENSGDVLVDVNETKFSHKVPIQIDGVDYYMMLTQT